MQLVFETDTVFHYSNCFFHGNTILLHLQSVCILFGSSKFSIIQFYHFRRYYMHVLNIQKIYKCVAVRVEMNFQIVERSTDYED